MRISGTIFNHPMDHRGSSNPLFLLLLLLFVSCPCLGGLARSPLLPGQPFLIFWAVPNKDCFGRPDPASFGMEWEGHVAEFYENSLGLYPYFSAEGQPVNGGLPQHTSLESHLQKVEEDLTATFPQTGAPGLGVLRWKEWEPQWSRNRGNQRRYLETSRALLRYFFPGWSTDEVEKWAQVKLLAQKKTYLAPIFITEMVYPICLKQNVDILMSFSARWTLKQQPNSFSLRP